MEDARVALPPRLSAAALATRDPGRPVVDLAGDALGTSWRVRFALPAGIDIEALRRAIGARLDRIAAEMSQWEPNSDLSRFNRSSAGSWTELPGDFATVLACALRLSSESGGAFDPTQGRAAALLGYGAGVPAGDTLEQARSDAGWERLAFDVAARRLRQPGGVWLDFSGIAKGFAVDALADLLREQGIAHALVEIGGELVGRGVRPDGEPWWVALEAPPGSDLPPFHLALHEQAVATSGNYRRGAHTIDPGTGRPLPEHVVSASVIHDTAMLADGWATALTVLGAERGIAAATERGIAARIVTREDGGFAEHVSPALAEMLGD